MPQEKLNNQSLRSRLADLDTLPGEELSGKSAAWGKLHDRLREKPHRIKPLWYWAAAALIIVCSLPFIITQHHTEEIAKKEAGKPLQPQQIKPYFNEPEKASAIADVPAAEEKKKIITQPDYKAPIKDTGKNDNNTAAVVPALTMPPQQETGLQPLVQETQPATASAPVKKKLRVVSINELNVPQQESALASSLPPAIVTKKFYNIPAVTPPVQEYAGVLKIKISLKH